MMGRSEVEVEPFIRSIELFTFLHLSPCLVLAVK